MYVITIVIIITIINRIPTRFFSHSGYKLVNAFCGDTDGLQLVWMKEVRFDPTPNYCARMGDYGSKPPLAWAALFRKSET